MDAPLVTVAVPLFRSARFVDNVTANIDRLTWPRLEILISDRHGLDDAAAQLARRYAGDPRVTVMQGTDGADWVAHYNDLIRQARGEYFCWMPHDDEYAEGCVETLAAALDRAPDAIMAFGALDTADCGRAPAVRQFAPPPVAHGDAWTPLEVVRLHLHWELMCLMRGLVRRGRVLEAGLLLPRPHRLVFADVCWAFAVSLSGRVLFVPETRVLKRYYASGASADWRFGVRQALSEWRTMSRAVWRSRHPRRAVWPALAVLAYVAAARVVWRSVGRAFGWSGARAPAWARAAALRVAGRAAERRRHRRHRTRA